jgi:hypothetical protein
MRLKSTTTLCIVAAWLTFTGSAHAVNLVSNGGFETGDFTGWTLQGTQSTLFNVADVLSHSGTYSMFFAELEADDDQIQQTVPTTIGQQYSLEFWLLNSTDGNLGLGDDGLKVIWEGNTVFDLKPIDAPLGVWTPYSLPLTATGNGSNLRIGGFDVPFAIYLDDISLTAVPEPGSVALATLSAIGFFAWRRRQRIA